MQSLPAKHQSIGINTMLGEGEGAQQVVATWKVSGHHVTGWVGLMCPFNVGRCTGCCVVHCPCAPKRVRLLPVSRRGSAQLEPDDRIVEVNGVSDDNERMLDILGTMRVAHPAAPCIVAIPLA